MDHIPMLTIVNFPFQWQSSWQLHSYQIMSHVPSIKSNDLLKKKPLPHARVFFFFTCYISNHYLSVYAFPAHGWPSIAFWEKLPFYEKHIVPCFWKAWVCFPTFQFKVLALFFKSCSYANLSISLLGYLCFINTFGIVAYQKARIAVPPWGLMAHEYLNLPPPPLKKLHHRREKFNWRLLGLKFSQHIDVQNKIGVLSFSSSPISFLFTKIMRLWCVENIGLEWVLLFL